MVKICRIKFSNSFIDEQWNYRNLYKELQKNLFHCILEDRGEGYIDVISHTNDEDYILKIFRYLLQNCPSLQSFKLFYLSRNLMVKFLNILMLNTSLYHLSFNDVNFNEVDCFYMIINCFLDMKKLKIIEFQNCGLTFNHIKSLNETLALCPNIMMIDISNNSKNFKIEYNDKLICDVEIVNINGFDVDYIERIKDQIECLRAVKYSFLYNLRSFTSL